MKKFIDRALALLLIAFIFTMFVGTMIQYGEFYAYGFLKGYKESLDENATVFDNLSARIARLNQNSTQRILFRNNLRQMNAEFQALLGKDMISIGKYFTVQLKTGGYYDLFTSDYTSEKTQELIGFAERVEAEMGIPTMFIYCHCGLYEDNAMDEIFYSLDNNNECADYLTGAMKDAGVAVVDSREVYKTSGLTLDQALLKSDVHWAHRMAFETAAETVRRMNAEFGFAMDEEALAYERFEDEVHEDLLFGEIAQRLGENLVERDDIHLIYPKYDTHIFYEAENNGHVSREGSFYEAILEPRKLALDSSGNFAGEENTAGYYVYGDYLAETHTVNEAAAPIKVLIFKDSYGTPITSFLSLAAKEVYALDLRTSDISMEEWVKKIQPDVVLFAYSQQMLRNFDYVIAE